MQYIQLFIHVLYIPYLFLYYLHTLKKENYHSVCNIETEQNNALENVRWTFNKKSTCNNVWTSLPTIFKTKRNLPKSRHSARAQKLAMFTNVRRDNNNEIHWVESWSSARILDKHWKLFFLGNEASYERILFYIFYSIFHVESLPVVTRHPVYLNANEHPLKTSIVLYHPAG